MDNIYLNGKTSLPIIDFDTKNTHYRVYSVIPSVGKAIVSVAARSGTDVKYQIAHAGHHCGTTGIYISSTTPVDSTVTGPAYARGLFYTGNVIDTPLIDMAQSRRTITKYPNEICLNVSQSRFLNAALQSMGAFDISKQKLRTPQLCTSWQGDFAIRDIDSNGGLFIGKHAITISGGKLCNINMYQTGSSIVVQGLGYTRMSDSSLLLLQDGQCYSCYTTKPLQAQGLTSAINYNDADKLKEADNKVVSGLYQTYSIRSRVLDGTYDTIVQCDQENTHDYITEDTKLRSVYYSIRSQGGKQLRASTSGITSIVSDSIPGVIYWQTPVKLQQLQDKDKQFKSRLQQIHKLRAAHPQLAAQLAYEQFIIPIQYTKSYKQLTKTRRLSDQVLEPQLYSCISQQPDGSIIIRDTWGSQIRMSGGNIYISSAKDTLLMPGRNLTGIVGQAMLLNTGAIQLSASQTLSLMCARDIAIKAGLSVTGKDAENDAQIYSGSLQLSGDNMFINVYDEIRTASAGICVVNRQDNGLPFNMQIDAGDTGSIRVRSGNLVAQADKGMFITSKGRGLIVDAGYTVIAGEQCACTGSLTLGSPPMQYQNYSVAGSGSHIFRATHIEADTGNLYKSLAVKQAIVCTQIATDKGAVGAIKQKPGKSVPQSILEGSYTSGIDTKYIRNGIYQAPEITPWLPICSVIQAVYDNQMYEFGWQRGAQLDCNLTVLIDQLYKRDDGGDTWHQPVLSYPGKLDSGKLFGIQRSKSGQLQVKKYDLTKYKSARG